MATDAGNDSAEHPLIRMSDVQKDFETPAGTFTALRSIHLEVGRGEFVAVMGKSGSGKSTLINMITGIDRPTSGEVWIAGVPIHALSEGKLAAWRGRNVGIVFQFFQLLPMLTAAENVMLPMDFCHLYSASERRQRAMALLEQFGVAGQAHKLPAELSGGEQQRAAIARALATDAPLLVADEPTGNLDSATAEHVVTLFEALVAAGKTIIMVTHDTALAGRARRLVQLADGAIVTPAGAGTGA